MEAETAVVAKRLAHLAAISPPPRAATVAAMAATASTDSSSAPPADAITSHLVHRYPGFNELYQLRLEAWTKPEQWRAFQPRHSEGCSKKSHVQNI